MEKYLTYAKVVTKPPRDLDFNFAGLTKSSGVQQLCVPVFMLTDSVIFRLLMNTQKHILLTGLDGFSGGVMSTHLLAAGHRVTAIGGRRKRMRSHVNGLQIIEGDLSGHIKLPNDIQVIVHTSAASPNPNNSVSTSDMIRDNAWVTRRLMHHARETKVDSFVYFSSLSVYGTITASTVNEETPIVESDIYGITKYLGEAVLNEAADDFPSVFLRLPGILGPGAVRNWLVNILEAAKDDRPITFFNGKSLFNNAAHIEDIAKLVLNIIEHQSIEAGPITVGAQEPIPVKNVISSIVEEVGSKSLCREINHEKSAFLIDSSRAISQFGYAPMSMRAMLKQFVSENGS